MWQHLALAVAWSTLAGCSLIYNPNNLPAPSDAEIVLDADPSMLVIDDVSPAVIYEGQGDFGSPPALIVLHGHHIIDSQTVVEITPAAGTAQLTLGTPVIASNGDWLAIPVTAHVDPGLKKGVTIPLDIRVQETAPPALGGATSMSTLSGKLTVVGLKELVPGSADVPELSGGMIDTTMLDERYARVDLSSLGSARFHQRRRAIVRSMSSITVKALVADGAPGLASGAAAAAVGGCAGGAPAASGDCPSGGGGGGGVLLGGAGGGGGGGFAGMGDSGKGTDAGRGGGPTGDELIVTYDGNAGYTANQAGGGGGGGSALGGGNGGGGAGGGSIELTAEGDLSVETISALGGKGADGGSTGGGGGAGGLVMLRAGGALAVSGTIKVAGGAGGSGSGVGGKGAGGRVRWDAPSGGPPATAGGTLHRGPAFTLASRVFRTRLAMITLVGQRDDLFDVYSIHDGITKTEKARVAFGPDDQAMFGVVLQPGHTRLCITLAGGRQGTSEADKCVDVAFLP